MQSNISSNVTNCHGQVRTQMSCSACELSKWSPRMLAMLSELTTARKQLVLVDQNTQAKTLAWG
jgi:hypothetical protein